MREVAFEEISVKLDSSAVAVSDGACGVALEKGDEVHGAHGVEEVDSEDERVFHVRLCGDGDVLTWWDEHVLCISSEGAEDDVKGEVETAVGKVEEEIGRGLGSSSEQDDAREIVGEVKDRVQRRSFSVSVPNELRCEGV